MLQLFSLLPLPAGLESVLGSACLTVRCTQLCGTSMQWYSVCVSSAGGYLSIAVTGVFMGTCITGFQQGPLHVLELFELSKAFPCYI